MGLWLGGTKKKSSITALSQSVTHSAGIIKRNMVKIQGLMRMNAQEIMMEVQSQWNALPC